MTIRMTVSILACAAALLAWASALVQGEDFAAWIGDEAERNRHPLNEPASFAESPGSIFRRPP